MDTARVCRARLGSGIPGARVGWVSVGRRTLLTMRPVSYTHLDVYKRQDQVAREIVQPGMPPLAAIRERFGPTVIQADGTLDRAGLAAVVFPDREALRALEAITGPAIADRVAQLRGSVPVDPVSYTHLDVYKRQIGTCGKAIGPRSRSMWRSTASRSRS